MKDNEPGARDTTIAEASLLYREHKSLDKMYAYFMVAMYNNRELWKVYRKTVVMQQKGNWPTDPSQPELMLLNYKKGTLFRYLCKVGLGFNKANTYWKRVAQIEGWVVVQNTPFASMKGGDMTPGRNFAFYVSHHHDDGRAWYTLEHQKGTVPKAYCPKCGQEMPRQCEAWIKINHLGTLLDG